MCGIAGILELDGAAPAADVLRRMAAALAHRGPDGEGVWMDGPMGLAHRRLAIIDLESGAQPMVREDLGRAVAFNGEIYNFVELREELLALGQCFHTKSDTEVILVGHAVWGDAILQRLSGMFALALWQQRERRLLLARDPLGKKPLSVVVRPREFVAFASEAKALFAVPRVARKANPVAIATYLDLMYVPEALRVWAAVERLPPGSWLAVEGGRISRGRYWRPQTSEDRTISFEAACREAEDRLERATKIRLRADVPVGVFLSGGVDSTLVALSAARQLESRVRAFTVSFDGDFDERAYAERVAETIGADLTVLRVDLDGPSLVSKVARYFDEPFGDTSAIPTLAMSWATKQHVKVVLSGDGGDELFGGYDTYLRQLRAGSAAGDAGRARRWAGRGTRAAKTVARSLPGPLARAIARVARPYRTSIDAVADASSADPVIGHAAMMRVAHFAEPPVMLAPLLAGRGVMGLDELTRDCPRVASPLKGAMLFDQLVYLPGDILKKVDIASMSVGLEVRAPILDDQMLALAQVVPADQHVRRVVGSSEERWRKRVLKQLCAAQMGDDFTYRPKAGFALPLQDWLDRPEFVSVAEDGFVSRASPISPWFRPNVLRSTWTSFRSGKRWLAQEVWNLVMLDAWAREHRPEF